MPTAPSLAALDLRDAFVEPVSSGSASTRSRTYYRIGIHTGVATLGNVGSINRRSFTAIGDTINLSKRLQENATGGQIIVSEDTLHHIIEHNPQTDQRSASKSASRFRSRGAQQQTRIYEVFRANA